jgi:hypothetical protein
VTRLLKYVRVRGNVEQLFAANVKDPGPQLQLGAREGHPPGARVSAVSFEDGVYRLAYDDGSPDTVHPVPDRWFEFEDGEPTDDPPVLTLYGKAVELPLGIHLLAVVPMAASQ